MGGIVPELEGWDGLYRSWRVGRDCTGAGGLGGIVPELEGWEGCTGARVLGENVPELEVLRVRRGYRGGMSGSCMKEKCCSRVGERISLKATEDVSWSLSQQEKHGHTDLFSFIQYY